MNTRRSFLKGMGLGSVAFGMSGIPGTLGAFEGEVTPTSSFVPSICEMCSTRCPIEARLDSESPESKGKKKIFIKGNPLSSSTGGSVCARGGAGVNQLFDPKRLVKPLMRVGERGEGKWKELSWEEAYTFIADKLNDIKQKHGAHSVAFAAKGGSESAFINQLAYAYGSPNIFDHGSTCPSGYAVALQSVFGSGSMGRDFANCKYMLNFGHNVYEGIVISYARGVSEALSKGCKLISFDPRFSIISSKAHEWIPIKPGEDVAFMLAFIHVMIFEELYDKKFVEKYTTGFEQLKESIKDYTPESMAAKCDMSAEKIRQITRECAAAAPAAMVDFGHRSTYTPEEIELRRAIAIANVLLGNIEAKGGLYFNKNPKTYNKIAGESVVPELKVNALPKLEAPSHPRIDGVDIKGGEFSKIPKTRGIYGSILRAALEGVPYPIKGMVMTRTNPVMTMADSEKVIQALKGMELVVCVDVYVSDTALFADVILPESTYLERDEQFLAKNGKKPGYEVRQKVIEPLGDTKPSHMIFKEIAAKLGLESAFDFKDMRDYRFKQAHEYPEVMQALQNKGMVSYGEALLARDKKSVEKFLKAHPKAKDFIDSDGEIAEILKCKTASGKIELFDEVLEAACGRGGLHYNDPKMKKDNELYFIQGKVSVHTNAHTANIPWLNDLMNDNALWVNEKLCESMGLKKGDKIKVVSEAGEQIARVLPTIGIREDSVFGYFGFGHISPGERSFNQGLSANHLLKHSISPVCGTDVHTIGVKIYKI